MGPLDILFHFIMVSSRPRRLYFYMEGGWCPTFLFFEFHHTITKYCKFTNVLIYKRKPCKIKVSAFKHLEKLGAECSDTNRILAWDPCAQEEIGSLNDPLLRRSNYFAINIITILRITHP